MTDGGVTAVLSLQEAAEQAATSKVDVWRAIQEGVLPAQKTSDGGYAIDPSDLFRVFERKEPAPPAISPEPTPAPDAEDVAKGDEAPDTAAAKEIFVAFAALQAELKTLLGAPGKGAAGGEEERQDEREKRAGVLDEQDAPPAAIPDAGKAKAVSPVSDSTAAEDKPAKSAETSRPWWRRLAR
jgi:hypothetical protein